MQFPTQFPFLVIPTGATTGQRITLNFNQDGKIKVYDSSGNLVDALGGTQGQFILYDSAGNMVASLASAGGTDDRTGNPFQPGLTVYTATSSINLFDQDGVWTAGDGSKVDISVGGSRGAIYFFPSTGSTPWFGGEINSNLDASSGIRPRLDITSPQAQSASSFSFIGLIGGGASNDTSGILMQAGTLVATAICTFGNIAYGSVNITPSAINTPTNATISYSILGSSFVGFATANTSVPQNVSASIRSITSTSATVTLVRSDSTTTTTVYWQVRGV